MVGLYLVHPRRLLTVRLLVPLLRRHYRVSPPNYSQTETTPSTREKTNNDNTRLARKLLLTAVSANQPAGAPFRSVAELAARSNRSRGINRAVFEFRLFASRQRDSAARKDIYIGRLAAKIFRIQSQRMITFELVTFRAEAAVIIMKYCMRCKKS